MSQHPETVLVKGPDGEPVAINKDAYDETVHTLHKETKAEAKAHAAEDAKDSKGHKK